MVKGKNLGRKNATTPEQQALSEARSKWEKKAKTGYTEDINKIDTCLTYVEPMLAKNFEDRLKKIDWKRGVLVQNKFNGNRAVATASGMEVLLKTRKGELWVSVPHINADLKTFFSKYPNAVLDGELFATSLVAALNELSKIVRREKDFTPEQIARSEKLVRFWVYDGYNFDPADGSDAEPSDESVAYEIRKAWIDKNLPKFAKYFCHVETTECHSFEEVKKVYEGYVAAGQEGAIIRIKGSAYEHTRSSNLLKWKPEHDSEGLVKKLHEGTGNWSGAIKTATIEWNGKTFDATFTGTYEQGVERMKHPEEFLNKMVTFKYNDVTGLGVPNFARIDPDNCFKNDR